MPVELSLHRATIHVYFPPLTIGLCYIQTTASLWQCNDEIFIQLDSYKFGNWCDIFTLSGTHFHINPIYVTMIRKALLLGWKNSSQCWIPQIIITVNFTRFFSAVKDISNSAYFVLPWFPDECLKLRGREGGKKFQSGSFFYPVVEGGRRFLFVHVGQEADSLGRMRRLHVLQIAPKWLQRRLITLI